jgi:hypothetical protein
MIDDVPIEWVLVGVLGRQFRALDFEFRLGRRGQLQFPAQPQPHRAAVEHLAGAGPTAPVRVRRR